MEDYRTYSVGVLEFSGKETIFPVDGQHRVEGIKKALEENPKLINEKVPVILIGHENSTVGKQRTRRLFSTLNRRARKVNDNELIALDEDDVVAVATREIIENNKLFYGCRLVNVSNKNIPSTNHKAFTSIIELYQCNRIIFDYITREQGLKTKEKEELLLYRPNNETTAMYIEKINEFWETMQNEIPSLKLYVDTNIEELDSLNNRNECGGNILFRPIALTQYINALCKYLAVKKCDIKSAVIAFNKIPVKIQMKPWLNVIWTQDNKINGRIRKNDVKNFMIFCVEPSLLTSKEISSVLDYWAACYGKKSMSKKELSRMICDLE